MPGLELYYDAFWELSTCRDVGWGLGPIPWTSIVDWARAFELDEEQADDLVYFIKSMDREYLKYRAPKKDE